MRNILWPVIDLGYGLNTNCGFMVKTELRTEPVSCYSALMREGIDAASVLEKCRKESAAPSM